METVYRCCCGIDVHKKLIVACLKEGGRQELREFGTMTGEIKEGPISVFGNTASMAAEKGVSQILCNRAKQCK